MSKTGPASVVRVFCLIAAVSAIAACSGGAGGSPAPASSQVPSAPSASPAPSSTSAPAVTALPLQITHEQMMSLFTYDTTRPLDIKDVTPAKTTDGVTIRDITFDGGDGTRVSAWLIAPVTSGSHAAVLYLHWLGQVNSNRDEFVAEATAMAKRGVVSLLPTRLFPGVAVPTDWQTDRASIAAQTIELRRGLDLLLAQPGVDPARLGFVGHDYGAMDGIVLASVDKRIKTAIFTTPDSNWADWFFRYFGMAPETGAEYRQAMKEFDPATLLPALAPLPVFLQFGDSDGYVSAETAAQITAAAPEPKKAVVYKDAGHELQDDASAIADRESWLADKLGLAK